MMLTTKMSPLPKRRKKHDIFLSVFFLALHLQISTGFLPFYPSRRTFPRENDVQKSIIPECQHNQNRNDLLSVLHQSSSSSSTGDSSKTSTTTNTNWQSYISRNPDSGSALYELLASLRGDPPDIVFLFVGQHHSSYFTGIVQEAQSILCAGQEGIANSQTTNVMAIVGGGVVGGDVEIDEPSLPSMSILCGKLPKGATVELFDFNELNKPPPEPESEYWERLAMTNNGDDNNTKRPPSYILFADPWSPVDGILKGLDGSSAGASVVAGGMSVPRSTQPTVAIDGTALPQGSAVGMCLRGTLGLQAVVAQGCRPVGPTFTITAHEGNNVLTELDGKPALECLEQVANDAPDQDKNLISSGYLLCGITPGIMTRKSSSDNGSNSFSSNGNNNNNQEVGHELTASPPQDFLVRQIIGFQPNRGGIVVAGEVKDGMLFRFHVKDRNAALDDMDLMVQRAKTERLFAEELSGVPMAALQISCVGRGRSLFGRPNVDLAFVSQLFADGPPPSQSQGNIDFSKKIKAEGDDDTIAYSNSTTNDGDNKPIAGFFGNAEYGPVGLSGFTNTCPVNGCEGTFVHGFTTIVAMLCDYSQQKMTIVEETVSSLDEPADAWG